MYMFCMIKVLSVFVKAMLETGKGLEKGKGIQVWFDTVRNTIQGYWYMPDVLYLVCPNLSPIAQNI